jgi:serine protease Do
MVRVLAKLPIAAQNKSGRVLPSFTALAAAVAVWGASLAPTPGLTGWAYADALQHPVGFAEVVARVKPAVIAVRVKIDATSLTTDDGLSPFSDESPLERFLRRFGLPDNAPRQSPTRRGRNLVTSQGSGFFISADGYAATNGHVVEKARTVETTTHSGNMHTAKVIGIDSRTDVALINVDGGNFPFVKFAEASPHIGDWVLAVGNPFGLGGTVTAGIVSAQGRDIGAGPYDDFIQIDAPVNRGNSGGPTFDMNGNVIGVNTAVVSPSGGSVGIAFAIPAETVKAVITQLKEKGAVTRGWIGVQIQQVTQDIADSLGLKEARGALVAEPQANGPAAKAGIETGDIIAAVNGKEISDTRELARTISSTLPGTVVRLSVIRKGEQKTVNVTLGTLPEQREANAVPEAPRQSGTNVPELGFTVTPQRGGNGVVISNLDPDGIAAERGLKEGDVVLEVGGKRVATAVELRAAFDAAKEERQTLGADADQVRQCAEIRCSADRTRLIAPHKMDGRTFGMRFAAWDAH